MEPPTKNDQSQKFIFPHWTSKVLIVLGIIIIIGAIVVLKPKPAPVEQKVEELPEAQLDRLLGDHKPILAFFHSNNCQSCIDMMKVVDQVHPEFKDEIALVDVNVYDERNQDLLRRAGIRTIPTQIFIDSRGEGQTVFGLMEPAKLRELLVSIKGNP